MDSVAVVLADGSMRVSSTDKSFIHVDAREIETESAVDRLCTSLEIYASRVKSLSLAGSAIPFKCLQTISNFLVNNRNLKNLEDLNLSNIPLSLIAVDHLCELLNPFKGVKTVKRLILANCGLGSAGTIAILTALCGNTVVEDILLSGNSCTDKAIPALVNALQNYENYIGLVGLAGNQITEYGLKLLCPVMGRAGVKIHTLQLGNNALIQDNYLDSLFVNMQNPNHISSLNLSNCGISQGQWARVLPFISSLIVLNLSHNNIDDDEFIKLCKGLETCFSLRYLDLSYNCFGGRRCSVIQQTLESNKSIYSINFSAIFFVDSIWRCLSNGLMKNDVLSILDVSNCDLNYKGTIQLCTCFQRNEVVSLVLTKNPLPATLISDPRAYCQDKANNVPITLNDATYLSLLADASVRSLSSSAEWRVARKREITTSLEHQRSLQMVSGASASASVISGATAYHDEHDAALLLPESVLSSVLGYLQLPHYKLMEKSEFYTSIEQMDQLILVADLVNAPGEKIISIAYGRDSLVIGSIAIISTTTYEEAKLLIEPVVREYMSNADPVSLEDLVQNFNVLDPEGKVVTGDGFQLRAVWLELCSKSLNTLVVRPANWLALG